MTRKQIQTKMKGKRFFVNNATLTIFNQNIAGLLHKSDRLIVALNELKNENQDIDVICLTEHFMRTYEQKNLNLPNYQIASSFNRKNKIRKKKTEVAQQS